jgi:hypothetical protein
MKYLQSKALIVCLLFVSCGFAQDPYGGDSAPAPAPAPQQEYGGDQGAPPEDFGGDQGQQQDFGGDQPQQQDFGGDPAQQDFGGDPAQQQQQDFGGDPAQQGFDQPSPEQQVPQGGFNDQPPVDQNAMNPIDNGPQQGMDPAGQPPLGPNGQGDQQPFDQPPLDQQPPLGPDGQGMAPPLDQPLDSDMAPPMDPNGPLPGDPAFTDPGVLDPALSGVDPSIVGSDGFLTNTVALDDGTVFPAVLQGGIPVNPANIMPLAGGGFGFNNGGQIMPISPVPQARLQPGARPGFGSGVVPPPASVALQPGVPGAIPPGGAVPGQPGVGGAAPPAQPGQQQQLGTNQICFNPKFSSSMRFVGSFCDQRFTQILATKPNCIQLVISQTPTCAFCSNVQMQGC